MSYRILFGSRLNDAERGGDIDLFIPGAWTAEEAVPRRLRFCAELRRHLGDQKIDVVVENKIPSLIQNRAKQHGRTGMRPLDDLLNECDLHLLALQEAMLALPPQPLTVSHFATEALT